MSWREAKKKNETFSKGLSGRKKWKPCVYVTQNRDIWVPNSNGRIFPLAPMLLANLRQCFQGSVQRFHQIGPRLFLAIPFKVPPPPPPRRFGPILGHGLPLRGFAFTFIGHTTLGRTPLEEWSAWSRELCLTKVKTHKRQISMFPAGFEPKIPPCDCPQIYALHGAATGTGPFQVTTC